MSRQLGRAHVGTGTSRVDVVSGCVNGCVRLRELLVSAFLGRGVSVAVSSMAEAVAGVFQVWVACTCVCLL